MKRFNLTNSVGAFALTCLLVVAASLITHTNDVSDLKTNYKTLNAHQLQINGDIADVSSALAITTQVLERLNNTLTKIDISLDVIVNETKKNSDRLDALELAINE
jgi:hypothetical protein